MIELIDIKKCVGCLACYNKCPVNCITINKNNEGFLYPKINHEKCNECRACIKVCPIIKKNKLIKEPIAYACYNNNENIRLSSSSGGIFTLLAEKIIDQDGIVFGASFDEKFNVIHNYADKKEQLFIFKGSKYVQSNIKNTYSQAKGFLQSGRSVLFIGTPCQIAGLKYFLGYNYNNLLCVDFICHGVPSPLVWQKYIKYQELKFKSSITNVNFRCKDNGWRNNSISIKFDNSRKHLTNKSNDLFMRTYLLDVCLRESCYA